MTSQSSGGEWIHASGSGVCINQGTHPSSGGSSNHQKKTYCRDVVLKNNVWLQERSQKNNSEQRSHATKERGKRLASLIVNCNSNFGKRFNK